MFYILWEKEHLIERFKKNSDILVTPSLTYSMKSSAFCYMYVNLSIKDNALHPQILQDRKYFPYFQDCLDVLDSTHIPAHVPAIDGSIYQNKKEFYYKTSQEYIQQRYSFPICLPDETDQHTILEDAILDKNFIILEKKYQQMHNVIIPIIFHAYIEVSNNISWNKL